MERKSIVLYVILTIVTCGIFGLYWFYTLAKAYEDAHLPNNVATTASVSLLLNIVTCSIYGMYCYYKWGCATPELFARYGKQGEDKSIMYLILAIFGLEIINLCLMQNDINSLSDGGNIPPSGSYGGGYPPYTPTSPSYQGTAMNPDFHAPTMPTAQQPCPPAPEAPSATPPTPPAPPAYR